MQEGLASSGVEIWAFGPHAYKYLNWLTNKFKSRDLPGSCVAPGLRPPQSSSRGGISGILATCRLGMAGPQVHLLASHLKVGQPGCLQPDSVILGK